MVQKRKEGGRRRKWTQNMVRGCTNGCKQHVLQVAVLFLLMPGAGYTQPLQVQRSPKSHTDDSISMHRKAKTREYMVYREVVW